jgi:GT2 family glycosyltransferase/glycosyltransferase involved in cell wall biosynthesis
MLGEDRLQEQVDWMETNPYCQLCYGRADIISDDGTMLGVIPSEVKNLNPNIKEMLFQNLVPACTAVYRAEVFKNYPKWFDDIKYGDYAINIIAANLGDIRFINKRIAAYRRHSGGITWQDGSSSSILEHIKIYKILLDHNVIHGELVSYLRESLALHCLQLVKLFTGEEEYYLAYEHARGAISYMAPQSQRYEEFKVVARDTYALCCEKYGKLPLFSIILTTYNRPELLKDALDSLAAQTFKQFEVILVNDHGDPVEGLIGDYEFPITYIHQGTNQGLSAARNAGLKLARGRYIAYLDDDDIYLPDHLDSLARAFETHPNAVIYTDVVYVQEHLVSGLRFEKERSFPTAHSEFDRDKLFFQNYIPVNTWAHPRSAVAEVGEFDVTLSAFEDWDMLLRLLLRYPVIHISAVTAEVRQRTAVGGDHMLAREHKNLSALYQEIYRRYPESDSERVQAGRKAMLDSLAQQDRESRKRKWGVPEWLLERRPSSARVAALQAIIAANPEVGTLGVAVIDTASDIAAVQMTLDRVREQQRKADSLWVISLAGCEWGDNVEWLRGSEPWPQLLNSRLEQGAMPDYLLVIFAGDVLLPQALLLMGEYRLNHPASLAWYMDEDVLVGGVSAKPMLKPDFNLDLLRSYPYIGRTLAFSTAALRELGGLDPAVRDLALVDLVWRLVERSGPPAIGHIPEVLVHSARSLFDWVGNPDTDRLSRAVTEAHLARMGVAAEVTPTGQRGLQRVCYLHETRPLVSIIIPTRDQLPVLRACVESLMEYTAYPHYELLIVDNGSTEPDACEFLAKLEGMNISQVRVLRWPQAFNYSSLNNFAVAHARGEVLLFLNNDIQITSKDWLSKMLGNALRPEIGLVGARLDYPDGQVQHGGLVLGMDHGVGFAFQGLAGDRQGYMSRLQAAQNVSAVSAACLMMRCAVFDELGGFDAQAFPIYYGDADLCMRATQAGYLLTIVPDTGLKHLGGATRLLTEKFGLKAAPDDAQRDHLYARWIPQLARDSAYHPAFGRVPPGFDLSPDAARIQEPLPGRPLPVVLAAHADWHGCGHYRVIQPFQALEAELRVEGGLKLGNFHLIDAVRIQPDVIVLQGTWNHDGILKQIERYRKHTGAKIVLEFDDYVPNIPVQSIHRKQIPQGIIKKMRRAIEQADWLVVSTPVLAQEYASYHPDIRVAHNGLSPAWWQDLPVRQRTGQKLRVGWAGGSGHTGDLAEIRALVKDMEDEVEWVFMGMQPKDIRCEFHSGVPIEQYPQKLANLNLDLAVVPLELNQFNRCKSNLRLLELGACSVPVICTDIEPYRCDLPVTRVRNRYQDWAEAIRSHLADPETLAQRGNALREAVLRNWILEGDFLNQWAAAWLPKQ